MISIKSEREISLMRKAGNIVYRTHKYLEPYIKPGITTKELDKLAYDFIISQDATPSFLNYEGFPASICASINEEVVHGIPGNRKLKNGDIIGIDIGACYKGYHGDAARTFAIGKISPEKQKLIDVTKECFFEGVKTLKEGSRLGDIGYRIQTHAEKHGYGVVRELVGHGIGSKLHEDPNVPNYGTAGTGIKLKSGNTIAIEPMINMGSCEVRLNGWDHRTRDGSPSAHYENTVLITETGYEILTQVSPEGREILTRKLEAE